MLYSVPNAPHPRDEKGIQLACAVLCCAVLCCAVLCCAVLCCASLALFRMAVKPLLSIFCEFLWAVAGNFVFLEIARVSCDDAVDTARLGSRVLHRIFKDLPVSGRHCIFWH